MSTAEVYVAPRSFCYRCGAEAIEQTVICLPHRRAHLDDEIIFDDRERHLEEYATLYAVASILYYEHDVSLMQDSRFDDLCGYLKNLRAWERYEFASEEMLSAGSGFDLTVFLPHHHDLAMRIANQ